MSTGVLLYCFDTPDVNYHKLAERCVEQIKKFLKLEITIVTDIKTYKKFKPMGFINFKLVEPQVGNRRVYREKSISWHNMERAMAWDHSPYDTTILMDCDYFVFTDNLLAYTETEYEIMLHNKVHDLTGKDLIEGKYESVLPIVWATVVIFKKTEYTGMLFALIKHIQKHYAHYRNLYRIKYTNYRNDFAFAIALHQLNGFGKYNGFIPTPMAMLAHESDVAEMSDTGIVWKHNDSVGYIDHQDVHAMDKEFLNG